MIFHSPLRVAVCLFLLLVSCAEKKDFSSATNPMPADSLISSEKMIHILADVHMIEAALSIERNEGLDSKDKTIFYYEGIFNKYHISRGRYDANMKYYSQNPSEMLIMYDKVIREIESRQKKLPSKK
ncbi:MAG: DUF4296 domain-containing protein [Bacteroidota bacterium]